MSETSDRQPSLFSDLDRGRDEPGRRSPSSDRAARDFATDPRHNVVLEASAGTGKTSVLVERYLNLLRADVEPSNVLAMTFTRQAAAEMRGRRERGFRLNVAHVCPAEWLRLARSRESSLMISGTRPSSTMHGSSPTASSRSPKDSWLERFVFFRPTTPGGIVSLDAANGAAASNARTPKRQKEVSPPVCYARFVSTKRSGMVRKHSGSSRRCTSGSRTQDIRARGTPS